MLINKDLGDCSSSTAYSVLMTFQQVAWSFSPEFLHLGNGPLFCIVYPKFSKGQILHHYSSVNAHVYWDQEKRVLIYKITVSINKWVITIKEIVCISELLVLILKLCLSFLWIFHTDYFCITYSLIFWK